MRNHASPSKDMCGYLYLQGLLAVTLRVREVATMDVYFDVP